MYKKDIIFLET